MAALSLTVGCASNREGLDPMQLPADTRGDYAVFARRCSKCHSLARALHSGIQEDSGWIAYVARMRRQPGSGIARSDVAPILRFLHYYSASRPRREPARKSGAAVHLGEAAP
jgi:hypothetical protein